MTEEAVLAVLVLLWGIVVALAGLVFRMLTKRQDKHGERITRVEDDVGDLQVGLADGKRDRQGLHYEMAQGFRAVGEKLDLITDANREAHGGIVRLIKNGGEGG